MVKQKEKGLLLKTQNVKQYTQDMEEAIKNIFKSWNETEWMI